MHRLPPEDVRVLSGPTDLLSIKSLSSLRQAQGAVQTAVERIITGKRINRAKDDPAGLIASEALESQRRSLAEIVKAADRASTVLDVAEGGLGVVQDLLQSLNGLAVSAANTAGLGRADRQSLQVDADAILQAIDYVVSTTTFNGERILSKGVQIQVGGSGIGLSPLNPAAIGAALGEVRTPGANPGDPDIVQTLPFTLADVASGRHANLLDGDPEIAQRVITSALEHISGLRAAIGSFQRHDLQPKIRAASVELENTTAAQSSIRDADIAAELVALFRGRILEQTSLTTLGIAGDAFRTRVLGVVA